MSHPTLSEMESRYEGMLQLARQKLPPSSLDIYGLREQEVLIDEARSKQSMPLRFHTTEQLAILLEPDRENQTDEGHYYARSALLEKHYLSSSAIEVLRKSPLAPPEPEPLQREEDAGDEEEEEDYHDDDEKQEETVKANGRTTITLGALIQQLQELQKTLGKNAPVWHVEFGGITQTNGAEEWQGGAVIE